MKKLMHLLKVNIVVQKFKSQGHFDPNKQTRKILYHKIKFCITGLDQASQVSL